MDPAHVFDELMALPPEQRREVARRALDSVEDPELAALEEAQFQEVERRRRRLESGETTAVPWESVRARLLAEPPALPEKRRDRTSMRR